MESKCCEHDGGQCVCLASQSGMKIFRHGGEQQIAKLLSLFSSNSPGAVSIPWNFLENIVVARGDVLFILDACFSAGMEGVREAENGLSLSAISCMLYL